MKKPDEQSSVTNEPTTQSETINRRRFLQTAGAVGLAASTAPWVITRPAFAAGGSLKLLQWSHFVPSYDKWFDAFAKKWGEDNGVDVTVDHVSIADLTSTAASEISASSGHDLIELGSQASQFEPSLQDMADINQEIEKDYGRRFYVAERVSYNPVTKKRFSFCHGWTIDPGDYRKSLWQKAGQPDGPVSWQDLVTAGGEIKDKQGVQVGIGMSQEIDSNMAARAVLWGFDSAVQDEFNNVLLDQGVFYRRSVEAVKYMKDLYQKAMTPEIFAWNAASNNQALIAGRASFILNSISAYRSAQEARPEIARDIFFSQPLYGPNHTHWANVHILYNYVIPTYSRNADTAKSFIKHLVANYDLAMYHSKLYNVASYLGTPAPGGNRGYQAVSGAKTLRDLFDAWYDDDPFRLPDEARGKLKPLKSAESWTTNVGHPGYANPAIGEVFNTFVLPNMMARAARGDESPEDAVKRAASEARSIFAKWHKRGLV
jgi:multiple sugar transport system substrate-binding protein